MAAELLILGLDGATWEVIDALGPSLPNLYRLRQNGAWARLNSTTPPMTLPAWSSILTGCGPGTHGIPDFTRRIPGTYHLEFLNSSHRKVPTIHQLLSQKGQRVASIAVPTTWPPSPLNGVMISGFDSPIATTVAPAHCEPRSLYAEIEKRFGTLKFADFQESEIGAGWHAAALRSLLREIDRKEAVCRWLLRREHWDLFMVVFGESDTVSHHFWMFHDPRSPRYQADPLLSQAITKVYQRLDSAVGELAAEGKWVCIASDHGFGGAGDRVLYLNRFLESRGWLSFGTRAPREPLRQMALKLPLEQIIRRMPGRLLGRLEAGTRYGDIDFSRTRAWSDELNYSATIHLNLRGRDPQGMIEKEDQAIKELTMELLEWEVEGQRVVKRVIPGQEAMPGGVGIPDLFIEFFLRENYSYTLLPSGRVPPGTLHRRLKPEEFVGGKGLGMNGSHRQKGVWILQGPGVKAGEFESGVEDVVPTLLSVSGRAVPTHMEGKALLGRESREEASWRAPVARSLDVKEEAGLRKRLEKLGYL